MILHFFQRKYFRIGIAAVAIIAFLHYAYASYFVEKTTELVEVFPIPEEESLNSMYKPNLEKIQFYLPVSTTSSTSGIPSVKTKLNETPQHTKDEKLAQKSAIQSRNSSFTKKQEFTVMFFFTETYEPRATKLEKILQKHHIPYHFTKYRFVTK